MLRGAIQNQKVSVRRPGDRFPQRSGWEHAAVTKTPGAIDHHDLAITPETQVLQAIIGNDDVDTPLDESIGSGNAIA
jgi:hypothetical protein